MIEKIGVEHPVTKAHLIAKINELTNELNKLKQEKEAEKYKRRFY